MKPNDFRIGNLILWNGNIHKINAIDNNFVLIVKKNLEKIYLKYEDIKPFELTYDLLDRLGFSDCVIENDNWKFTAMFYDGWWISYKEKEGYGDTDCQIRAFLFVHEFQNLFFSLTGEELVFFSTEP